MEFLNAKIFGFILILARVGAFFATSPVFGWKSIPMRVKTGMMVTFSIFVASIVPLPLRVGDLNPIEMILLLSREVIYGLALGLIAWMIFTSVKLCARVIERQMGLALASVMDPLSEDQGNPLGILLEIIFILLFFAVNGHHLLMQSIVVSYDHFAAAGPLELGKLVESIIFAGSTMLLIALKLSAPILAAFLLMMMIMAVMARIAPEMNILFLSLPIRVGIGILLTGLFIPFILSYVRYFDVILDRVLPF